MICIQEILPDINVEVLNGFNFLLKMRGHLGLTVRQHHSLLEHIGAEMEVNKDSASIIKNICA